MYYSIMSEEKIQKNEKTETIKNYGLSSEEAEEKLARFGANALPESLPPSLIIIGAVPDN